MPVPTPQTPANAPASEPLAVAQVTSTKAFAPYRVLLDELQAGVSNLQALYEQRSALLADEAELVSRRGKVSNELYARRSSTHDMGALSKELERIRADRDVILAQLDGCRQEIDQAEVKLHSHLPPSCDAFQRLFISLASHILESDTAILRACLHPTQQESHNQDIEALSAFAEATIDFKQFAPPSGQSYAITRPLQDDAACKHSEVRQETMQNVINIANRLVEQASGILAKAQDSAGFQVPVFKLGPDEPTQPTKDKPLGFNQSPITYTFDEEELIELAARGQTENAKLLLREAGKTEQDLEANPALREALVHSERLHQASKRLGGVPIQSIPIANR
jgi:hypothetical protein